MIMNYKKQAAEIANKYGIPVDMFLRMIGQESNYDPTAVSGKGAYGLTQLMPGTAEELGVDPTDPLQNMDGGARYLKQQYDRFGTWPLALAAYNAGPRKVKEAGGIPDYRETRNYVAKIMQGGNPQLSSTGAPPPNPWTTNSPAGVKPTAPFRGLLDSQQQAISSYPKDPYSEMSPMESFLVSQGFKQDAEKSPMSNIWSALQGNKMNDTEMGAMDMYKKSNGRRSKMMNLFSMFGG
jgi:hypothetical protein